MEIQDYTDSEFKHALARNLRSLTRGKKSSKQPIAILLGGQSGAGKTTIHRIKQKEFQGNIVIIDGDSFRSQHPHYLELQQEYGKDSVEYTKYFAGKMVESLVRELSHLGYNLLIEGTLRTLSRLYRYQDSQGISIDDESNPWILMSDDLSDLIQTNIYLVENFDEIERYSGYLDGIERMLEISEKRMVA
ncbi:zeta toxin family protein [Streptococcus pneumoniae]|uniref:zeta toxin family protein n=1 Tax=Streptococcus pneumoniae TaxID=1313 RepID=UPI0005DC85E5|nr:signal recognition particle GTPase [Streptococcus pneumoniae]